MSNSNFNITKVTVDPVSQEISSLEINGKPIETGGEANLEEVIFDGSNPLNVETIFRERTSPVQIYPSEGYDGIDLLTIYPGGLTGYPDPSEMYETMYSAIMLKLLNFDPLDPSNLAVDWDDGQPVIRQVFLDEPLPEYGSQVITTKIYVPVGDGTLRRYYLSDLLYAQTTGECGDQVLIVKLGNDYYSVSTGPTTEITGGSSPWYNIESGVEVQVLKSNIISN